MASSAPRPAEIGAAPARTQPSGADGSALAAMAAAQKLIRNAEVSIEVKAFEAAGRKAAEVALSFGGYVADAQSSGETKRRRGMLTLRVPSARFDEALRALEALGDVRSEHVAVSDVTKAYSDLVTRLRVKRDAADRIREILRNRTAKLSDVLEAEKQLSALVEEIETMEGERRYYDQRVALSTISADLHEPESVARRSAFTPLAEALHDSAAIFATSLAALIVGVLYVLPWAIPLALLLVVFRRIRRRAVAAG
jgi:hypothetical protein